MYLGYQWNNPNNKYYLPPEIIEDQQDSYSEVCNFMLVKGLEFIDDSRTKYSTDPKVKFGTIENVYGIATPMNKISEELDKFLIHVTMDYFGKEYAPSGAQFQAVVQLIQQISKDNEWSEYIRQQKIGAAKRKKNRESKLGH